MSVPPPYPELLKFVIIGDMHILHVTPYYAPAYAFGGVTRSVEGMARALARRGHSVTVLTTDALDQTRRCERPYYEILEHVTVARARNFAPLLRGRLNLSTPYNMRGMGRALLAKADVVHCHEFRTVENVLVTPLAEQAGKPLVLSPHGTLALHTGRGTLKRAWDGLLSPAVGRRFVHVVGLSAAEADEARALWETFASANHQPDFSAIPNGVDPDEYAHLSGREVFRARYGLGDGRVCLFMGRLHQRKGVGLLVEAFKTANVAGARLVIAGPDEGMLSQLQPMLDERIILTGYLSGVERLGALAGADLLALPAVGEGLPMVVLEGMAAGLPVIVSPGCNLPEVAQYGAGLEVEAALQPLTQALRDLLSDPAKRSIMGEKARQLVRQRFTWDYVAGQLEAVYQRCIQEKSV